MDHRTGRPVGWAVAAAPPGDSSWAWTPGELGELPGVRRELRAGLAVAEPDGTEETGDLLVLFLDELLSNALRHGAAPVRGTVSRCDGEWVVEVSDSAADAPPQPVHDRDPAHGGMGLRMITALARRHGWFVDDGRKHVWASLPAP
jgi:hypothetical protein